MYKFKTNPENVKFLLKLCLYLTNTGCIIVFAILGYFLFDAIAIISTSLCGSFCFVFGFGLICG